MNMVFNSFIANNTMWRTMRTAHRKHLTRVGEGCAPVICHYSCDLEDGVTLDKVTLVDGGAEVSGVLTEGQWGDLELECAQDYDKFCEAVKADAAISVWESQQDMVAA